LIITVTPGGGVTTVTSLITSVVIASPPPSTVTKWVPPSNVAKREEQLPEEEGEDAPFIPTITHLPEAAPESEQEKEDDYDNGSSLYLFRREDKLPTLQRSLNQLVTWSN
jgi:hypothetical protein